MWKNTKVVLILLLSVVLNSPSQSSNTPSETFIAFFTERHNTTITDLADLVVLNFKTREEQTFTLDGITEPTRLGWSPDRKQLALTYSTEGDTTYNLTLFDVEDSQTKTIVDVPDEIVSAQYSPDGTQLLYQTGSIFSPEARSSLAMFSFAENTSTQLTGDLISTLAAFWSPDGTRVALYGFMSGASGGDFGIPPTDIYVADLQTGEVTNLTKTPDTEVFPQWSSEGAQIAYSSDESGSFQIYLMNADGTGKRRLTDYELPVFGARWAVDSTHLIYVVEDQRRTKAQFVLHDLQDDQQEVLLETGIIDNVEVSPDGTQVAYIAREAVETPAQLCMLTIASGETWCAKTEPLSTSAIAW